MDWLDRAKSRLNTMPKEAMELRKQAEDDLWLFARLVNPTYMYGDIHRDIFRWIQQYMLYNESVVTESNNKLLMLPRAHLKSHTVATAAAWLITRHPEITILYLSATAELAILQLYAIKNILTSDVYRRYWPEYINPDEGHRRKWTETKIIIDHERVAQEAIRDPTVTTAGLTTNTTGWHADVIVSDDLVIPENAYTVEQRNQVKKKVSQFASIRNPGGFTLACGTRYHPADIYGTWKEQEYDVFDDDDVFVEKRPVWDIREHVVETDGDFLWPRTVRTDGKAFGFNRPILARIEAEYEDREQFFAQYYNDPNKLGGHRITNALFQYFDQKFMKVQDGAVYFRGERLNVLAAMDFAYSLNQKSDYTTIAVVGMSSDGDVYIIDLDRFKTNTTLEYCKRLLQMQGKWEFKRVICEATAAQEVLVEDVKNYITSLGVRLTVEPYKPDRRDGAKPERISSVLDFRYENRTVWHYKGGLTPVLEDELISLRPPHDDVKDAVATAVMHLKKPGRRWSENGMTRGSRTQFNSRFGGRGFR